MADRMRELMDLIKQVVEGQKKEAARSEQVTEQSPKTQASPSVYQSAQQQVQQKKQSSPAYARLRSSKPSRPVQRPPQPRPKTSFQRSGGVGTWQTPFIPPAPLPNLQAPKIATRKRLKKIGRKPPRAIPIKQPMSRWRSTERLLGAAGGFVPALGEIAGLMQKLRHFSEAAGEFGKAWGPKPPTALFPGQLPTAIPVSQPGRVGPALRRGVTAAGRAVRNVAGRAYQLTKTAGVKARAGIAALTPKPRAVPTPSVAPTKAPAPPPATERRGVPSFFRSEMLYQTPQQATQSTARQAIEAGLPVAQVQKVRQQAEDFYQRQTRNRHARLQAELLRGKEAGLSDEEAMKKGMAAVEKYLGQRARPTQLGSRENTLGGGQENVFREMTELLRGIKTLLERDTGEGRQRDTGQLPPRESAGPEKESAGSTVIRAGFAGAQGSDPVGGAVNAMKKEAIMSTVRSLAMALLG